MLNDLFAYVVVFTVLIVGITAYIENTKYKNSSYGKQSTRSFWNILNDKGARGEYRMSELLDKSSLEKKLLFNVYIPKKKEDDTTEIDIIMICTKGIYVLENKNYSGWILGSEKDRRWCETLNGKKYFFYNPIRQNNTHIKYLEKLLQIGEEKYTSLITFNSSANLKKITVESENVYVIAYNSLSKFLKNEKAKPDRLTSEEINQLYERLLPLTQVTKAQKQQHIDNIKKKYQKH